MEHQLFKLKQLKDIKFSLLLPEQTLEHMKLKIYFLSCWLEISDKSNALITYDYDLLIDKFYIEFHCNGITTEDAQTLSIITDTHPSVLSISVYGEREWNTNSKHSIHTIVSDDSVTLLTIECGYDAWNHPLFGIGG